MHVPIKQQRSQITTSLLLRAYTLMMLVWKEEGVGKQGIRPSII